MAKTAIPRLVMREYDVHLEGSPRKRIPALSADAAELEYRKTLGLYRVNLDITVVDITTQREKNNGLTDRELQARQEQRAADEKARKERAVQAVALTTAEAERKAHEFLEAAAAAKEKAQLQEITI